MRAGRLIILVIAGLIALPAAASAKTFTVNVATDTTGTTPEVINGVCDADNNSGNGNQCELRGAVQEANQTTALDTVKFSSSFNGELADVIQLSNAGGYMPLGDGLNHPVTIDGGDCGNETISHKPCAEVRGPTSNTERVFSVSGGAITVRGLAITNGHYAGFQDAASSTVKITNTWFGVNLDGATLDPNERGIDFDGGVGGATIGGTSGADRNVFAGGDYGVKLRTSDNNKIRGNYFGVMPDGVTPAPSTFANNAIAINSAIGFDAKNNVIGASIDSSHQATAKCDGGCNVIANAAGAGIDLHPAEAPALDTTVKGNFIGLGATGATAVPNATGIDVGESNFVTIGGDTSAERNFITGGTNGIDASTNGADDPVIKRNFIGLNSAGTAELDAPNQAGIAEESGNPALISRNRIVGASNVAIQVSGFQTRVIRNKIGLDKDGNDEPGPAFGIFVGGNEAKIGEPGAGNTVGNVSANPAINIEGGDENKVQGNYLGVDSAGVSHPNTGDGIRIVGDADGNVIGGTSGTTENVISNSDGDAIEISFAASAGNQIKRNRGKDNGAGEGADGLFIDLGNNGFGNGTGANGMTEAPVLDDALAGDTTRSHTQGTCEAGATLFIFRTSSAAGASPNRINAFVKTTTCTGGGTFSTNFSTIPSGQRLTALQLVPGDSEGSSELASAVDPVVAP